MPTFQFVLGEHVRDRVTTLSGVIIARAEYLEQTTQYLLTTMDAVGHPIEWWVPETRLECVD